MSLRDILMPGSIRKLADAVRAIADALEFIQTGEEIPVRFRRRLAPVVIGQDGFLPSARGIVWDLLWCVIEITLDMQIRAKLLQRTLGGGGNRGLL